MVNLADKIEPMLDRLVGDIGVETPQDRVAYDLKFAVRELRAPTVGVLHVTCSDEAERETVEIFQRCFVQDLAPRLTIGGCSALRSANLGGRFEWSSLAVAEANFSQAKGADDFKLMVVKINSHVGVIESHTTKRFGMIDRYGKEAPACSALRGFLDGTRQPHQYVSSFQEQFSSEGLDRRERLKEIADAYRYLAAAVVSARLQARSAAMEAQDHLPVNPTVYVIIPCVTLHCRERNAEILAGIYLIDRRSDKVEGFYRGLGDDPLNYSFSENHGLVQVSDASNHETRLARDHRQLIKSKWKQKGETQVAPHNVRVDEILKQASHHLHHNDAAVKGVLRALLPLLAEVSPVSAALILFTSGVSGIYQVYRAHKAVEEVENDADARLMLADLQSRLDHMPADQARKVLQVLLDGHRGVEGC